MATDRLTIVVPIHGQIDTTLKFIESFERQTVNCPLVFVDDRSPDDSVSILRKRGYEVEVPDDRLWYNGILQKAIDTCETEFLAVLNNDLVLPKHYVEALVSTFDESQYDMLVPRTVDLDEYSYLDAERPYAVRDLLVREGWCVAVRVEKFRKLPKIPKGFRLWCGDDWMFHFGNGSGCKMGKMDHVRVFHEFSHTINATDSNPIIEADKEYWRANYPWLRASRLPPNKKPPERFGIDPASKNLLRIQYENWIEGTYREDICIGPGWPYLQKHPNPRSLGSVVVCLPVRSTHERFVERFKKVIMDAWKWSQGPFSSMKIEVVLDEVGRGAGWGRNVAVARNPGADYYFFVDVDDLPKPYCFEAMNYAQSDVVWGIIEHRKLGEKDAYLWVGERSFEAYEWEQLVVAGFRGGTGLNNAFFIKGDLARRHRWFENLFAFEDIEYFIVVGAEGTFERLQFPLATIDNTVSKPKESHRAPKVDHELIGGQVQKMWQRLGRRPLTDEEAAFRNSCATIQEFYG